MAACALLMTSRAHAEPVAEGGPGSAPRVAEAGAVERARARFDDASQLARRGEWAAALDLFEEAYALYPHPATLYDMAYCARALRQYGRAWTLFTRAAAEHHQRGDKDLSGEMLAAIERYLAELVGRVARVKIHAEPPSAEVSIDGQPLPHDADEVVLDAGRHRFVVASPGLDSVVVERTVTGGERVTLELRATTPVKPVFDRVAVPAASAGTLPANEPMRREAGPIVDHAAAAPHAAPWFTYTALGVGAAGLATGAVTGVWALVDKGALAEHCVDHVCVGDDQARLDRARTLADVATAAFVVGGIGTAAGIALLVWSPSDRAEPPSASIRPFVSAGSFGCRGDF